MTRPLITHAPRCIDVRFIEDRYGDWRIKIDFGLGRVFRPKKVESTIAEAVATAAIWLMEAARIMEGRIDASIIIDEGTKA